MEGVLKVLQPVVKQTPKELEKARNMSRDIDGTAKDISQMKSQLDSVEAAIPTLNELADNIAEQQAKVDEMGQAIGEDIENLKRQIETARQIANDIKVGVKFAPSTVLELKTPETLPLLATKSKVSAYFKTENPNGFLMFLGNDNKTAAASGATSKNNDFMALEILNGYPILTIDLGNGPERVTNEKYVADGNWYQAVVDRTGANAKLIIREESEDGNITEHVNEAALVGANNVFNVDRNSRLFVGGYPPDGFVPPEDIHTSSFVGEIEDLRIGDEQVGLWNFVYGEDNTDGAQARNKLISEEIPPTGYRFNGNGYVVMKATPYNFKTRSSIQFSFKAAKDAKDGLMFLYGRNNHFMSVELVDGGVYFRYKLGEHIVSTGSEDRYNDNEWHRVVAERDGRRGLLKVDDVLIFQEEAPAQADENMPAFKRMFFGGYPGKRNNSEIVEHNFDGCIDDVTIAGTKVDLGQHLNAVGVKPGCPSKFSTILAYPPHEYGFLRTTNITSNNNLNVNLKFKTRQRDGVLFYAANHDQSSTAGLTLDDGYLTLRSMGSELVSDMRKLNDGEEHVVTVLHDGNQLRLAIDDKEDKRLTYVPEPLNIYGGDVFFGGLPDNYIPPRGALSTLAYFVGCISDVTINGEIINFADSTEKKNGNINNCPADILAYDITSVPTYFPGGENELLPHPFPDNSMHRPATTQAPWTRPIHTTPATTTSTTTTTTTTTTRKPIMSTSAALTTTERPHAAAMPAPDQQAPHKPSATRKPKPPQNLPEHPLCKLPTNPNFDVDFVEAGYRLVSVRDQRLEIPTLPVKLRKHYDVAMSFRTSYPYGVLFYAADKDHKDFVAVYLKDGRVCHRMRLGSEDADICSGDELNDGEWHTVKAVRTNRRVNLFIDNIDQDPAVEMDGSARPMMVEFPIYVGGTPKYIEESVKTNIEESDENSYYNGCLRDIKFNGAALEKEPNVHHAVPCSEQVEDGWFFHKPTGFVRLFERFSVGTDFSLSFDFRPREPDGLLFSVHGKNTYMILELVDNSLWFTVKSDARNIVVTNYTLPDNGSYCDGKWRYVQAVKSKFVITITVDYVSNNPGVGTEGSTITKTNRPLFLGGHQAFNKAPGLKTKKTFKGCIRNIQVNKKDVRITPNLIFGEIWQGVCPLH